MKSWLIRDFLSQKSLQNVTDRTQKSHQKSRLSAVIVAGCNQSSLRTQSIVLVHLLPLLQNEIAAAPRWGHRVTCISVVVKAVQLWRRRAPENRVLHAFLVLTLCVVIQQTVCRFKRFIEASIVQEWRRLAAARRNRIELLLLHLLRCRGLRLVPELVLGASARDHRRICTRAHIVVVVGRHFLEVPAEPRVVVDGRLGLVGRRPLFRRRPKFVLSSRVARLVRRRA